MAKSSEKSGKAPRRGGTPPPEYQFQPGVSGNPGGRPKKKATIRDTLNRILQEDIANPDAPGTITRMELLAQCVLGMAATDPKEMFRMLRWLEGDQPAAVQEREDDHSSAQDQAIIQAALDRFLRRQSLEGAE